MGDHSLAYLVIIRDLLGLSEVAYGFNSVLPLLIVFLELLKALTFLDDLEAAELDIKIN